MLNTRLAIRRKKKDNAENTYGIGFIVGVIREIVRDEGVSAFYKGVVANQVLLINPIISMVAYEKLKLEAISRYEGEANIPLMITFMLSSVGKVIAQLTTYPILTIRVRQQANKSKDQAIGWNLRQLYKGIETNII